LSFSRFQEETRYHDLLTCGQPLHGHGLASARISLNSVGMGNAGESIEDVLHYEAHLG